MDTSNPSCTRCHHIHKNGPDKACVHVYGDGGFCTCSHTVLFPHYPEVVRAVEALEAIAVELAVSNELRAGTTVNGTTYADSLRAEAHARLFPKDGA